MSLPRAAQTPLGSTLAPRPGAVAAPLRTENRGQAGSGGGVLGGDLREFRPGGLLDNVVGVWVGAGRRSICWLAACEEFFFISFLSDQTDGGGFLGASFFSFFSRTAGFNR